MPATINITKSYAALNLDLTKLAEFLVQEVQPFMGSGSKFSGSHVWNDGATVEQEFESIDLWSKPPVLPLESVRARIWSKDYVRSFNVSFYAKPPEVHVAATVLETEKAKAITLILAFQKTLGFQERVQAAPEFRLEIRYLLPSEKDGLWLRNVLTTIGSLQPQANAPRGTLRLRSGENMGFDRMELLLQRLPTDLSSVDEVFASFSFAATSVGIRCALVRAELEVTVTAPSEPEARSVNDQIHGVLGLNRIEGGVQRQGLTKGGFVQTKFDAKWFEESIRHLRTEFPGIRYFLGEITSIQGDGPRTFNDLDAWLRAILTDWERTKQSYLSIESSQRVARITFWHLEESARLKVEAPSLIEAKSILNQLGKAMHVEFIEHNPYAKANSSSTFAIRIWQDRAFAEAVRDTVPVAIGRGAWIVDAWIKEEGDQGNPLLHAKTLEEYLKLLQAGKRYIETDLQVNGPRGRALRIHVYENRSRLDLSSSLTQTELDNVAEGFKTSLKLKTLKEIQSGKKPDDDEPKQKSLMIKGLGVVGAYVAALLLSVAFIKGLVPQYSVTIVSPHGGKDDERELVGPAFRIEWSVHKEHFFRKVDLEPPRANIRVVEGQTATDYPNQASGEMVLETTPGSYVLTVSIPTLKASETVYFKAKAGDSP